jgi:hypothetical protein
MPATYGPYIGSGKVYMRKYGSTEPLEEIGNCSVLQPGVSENRIDQNDYTIAGGGTYASVSRIESVTFEATLHDLNPLNLARALFGTNTAVTGATVSNEQVVARRGGLARLAHPSPTTVSVTHTSGTPTYVAGTDYEVRPEGIYVLTAGAITDAQTIRVSYTYAAYARVEGLVAGAADYEIVFAGLNEANSNKPVIVDMWKVQLSPAEQLALIGEEFAELTLTGRVLKDTTKTGAGISQYMRVQMQ